MCYGDIDHGNDGYYREWAERQARNEDDAREQMMREEQERD